MPSTLLRQARAELPSLGRLALPVVLGLAAANIVGVTDTLMLAPLGATPLAATSLTMSVCILFYATIYGVLSALSVNIAHAFGAGDHRAIARETRVGLALAALIGAAGAALMLPLYFVLEPIGQPQVVLEALPPYWAAMAASLVPWAMLLALRQLYDAIDRPWLGAGFAFLGVILNLPLNYVLIYGPGPLPALDLAGAGLASFLAQIGALLGGYLFWRRARSMRRIRVRTPVSRAMVLCLGREGAPLGLMYAAEAGAFALVGVMMGWFGAAALAANQVVMSVGGLLYMLPLGMAGAAAIRVGQAAGAGEHGRLRAIGAAALGAVTIWTVAATIALALTGEAIARAITADAEVAAIATAMFVVVAGMQIGDGLQSTGLGALRGLKDYAFPSNLSLVTYWIFALPAAYLVAFPSNVGPPGLWIGFGLGIGVAAVALPVRFFLLTRPRPGFPGGAAPG